MDTYMLVVPPEGDIERVEMSRSSGEAFARIQQEASARKGSAAHVQAFEHNRRIEDVIVFLDENAGMFADGPGMDLRENPRAAWLLDGYLGVPIGPMVVTGRGSGTGIPGLSLARTVHLISLLDGAV